MKTAVEHLQAEFNKWAEGKVFIPQDLLEKAKELEKEQIIDAFKYGWNWNYDAEKYYNETYNHNL